MDELTKIKLIDFGRYDLVEIHEINQAGYAVILPSGGIVDRRLFPEAYPVPQNKLLNIPEPKNLVEHEYDIWAEGYRASGDSATAGKCNKKPIKAYSFDDAVLKYIATLPESDKKLYRKNEPKDYSSALRFINRSSNWTMWGCNLFDNQSDAAKSFG